MPRVNTLLLIAAAAAAGLWLYMNNQATDDTSIADEQDADDMTLQNNGNNNPGNIRASDQSWLGKIADGVTSAFERFVSPEYGVRAVAIIFQNYYTRYGLDTVRDLITRYAPPSENDTENYANFVAGRLGVSPDTPLNVPQVLPELVAAVLQMESGTVVTPDYVRQAMQAA
ncbi:MAG TPA: hypothetical protein VMH83_06230 [Candidatus Acidoferrum sp.]|nr:hypothetical protein [Candidatus Acidoferrum sp.]